jgi:hypothetical protein
MGETTASLCMHQTSSTGMKKMKGCGRVLFLPKKNDEWCKLNQKEIFTSILEPQPGLPSISSLNTEQSSK